MKRVINTVITTLTLIVSLMAGQAIAGETVTYYHLNNLGSPVAATDESGAIKWREHYQPYGERLLKEGDAENSIWFTGKQEEVGLTYMGARWYDPELGRFLEIDPVGFHEGNPQSFNRYAYANNNPYKYVDPDGRLPILAAIPWIVGTLSAATTGYEIGSAGYGLATGQISVADLAGDVGQDIAINTVLKAVPGGAAIALERKLNKATKGLTTPKKYFGSKTKSEVKETLEKKFGPPKSSREHADTYYNDKAKRSYNVHEEPGHNDGKPHVDIRRRGGYEERKYDLKEGE